MRSLIEVAAYATVAGLAIPAGGLIARLERVQPKWLEQELCHGVLAFGGGVLIAAVALILVPEGIRHLAVSAATGALLAGGLAFLATDRALAKRGTPASMLLATLLDFLPEALALGAAFTASPAIGPLLALFIALSDTEVARLVAFLHTLTDPCVTDRDCLAPWIPDPLETDPYQLRLRAVDQLNNPL